MKSSSIVVLGLVLWLATRAYPQWDPYAEVEPSKYSPKPAVEAPTWTTASGRIHILIVADSNDKKVGKGLAVDLKTVEATFRRLVSNPEQVNFKVLKGDAVTKEAILQALVDFRPGYADTIALFFSGHGSHNGHGHFLGLSSGDLYRCDIISAMRETKARLAVLVTNGCNLPCEKEIEHVRIPRVTDGPIRPPIAEQVSPIIEELFLKPHGVVDINGASEGQVCWAEPPRGTTTMRPLCDCLLENRDKRLNWNAFVTEFGKKVQQELELRKYRNATNGSNGSSKACQTPRVWSLPQEDRGPRFGVEAVDDSRGGVQVARVRDGFPAQQVRLPSSDSTLSLEPYDIILTVNGTFIRGREHFVNLVMGSPQEMTLVVRDCRTGRWNDMRVTLRY